MERRTHLAPLPNSKLAKRLEELVQQEKATAAKTAQTVDIKQLTREMAKLERRKQKRISEGRPPQNADHQTMHSPISGCTFADSPAGSPQYEGMSEDVLKSEVLFLLRLKYGVTWEDAQKVMNKLWDANWSQEALRRRLTYLPSGYMDEETYTEGPYDWAYLKRSSTKRVQFLNIVESSLKLKSVAREVGVSLEIDDADDEDKRFTDRESEDGIALIYQ
ncbi:MAG: hypothetical protein M1835_007605 [Candelina submexicana]|nr:MAG: hypothetical protein M1835_007605 [Candelina submexicana]